MPNFHKFKKKKKKIMFWLLSSAVIDGSLDCVLDYEFSFKLALGFGVSSC